MLAGTQEGVVINHVIAGKMCRSREKCISNGEAQDVALLCSVVEVGLLSVAGVSEIPQDSLSRI